MSDLRIAVLGTPRIEVEGVPLDVETRKAVALLAYLAATDGPHTRESLATLLWPDSDRDRGRASLRRTLSMLNAASVGPWLVADRSMVALAGEDPWVDVRVFRRATASVGAHGHAGDAQVCDGCLDDLEEAVALYRDEFLAGFGLRDSAAFDDWQRHTADELRHAVTVALDQLVAARTRRGELEEAAAHATRRLAIGPLHEPTHRQLVLLHAWRGRRAEAMRQYERCRELLDRELGVEPLDETRAAYEAVRDGLTPPPPAPRHPSVEVRPASGDDRGRGVPGRAGIVGRDEELRALAAVHADATARPTVVAIEGEAGVGRTTLLDAFAADARSRGATVVAVRGRETEHVLAYGVLADALRDATLSAGAELADEVPAAWLSEVARIVPELREVHPHLEVTAELDAPELRRRLLEGVRRTLLGALAGTAPGVLVVDDAHWVDDASLDALLYLADRLDEAACVLVFAWRSEALAADHRLRRLVADLRGRAQAVALTLEPFGSEAVAELVAAAGHDDPDGTLGERLHRETRGLPLFVAEFLRDLPQQADDAREVAGSGRSGRADAGWRIPATVRDVLRGRRDAVSGAARELAVAASVFSRPFDLDTLLAAGDLNGTKAVAALEELLRAGILEERLDAATGAPPIYDFPLHALRSLVYEESSLARRRLLHGRVADALAATGPPETPAGLAAMAQHLQLAGRDREAAECFVRAAEAARSVVALDEAIDHLGSALALGHEAVGPMHESLGDLETLRGDYQAAVRAFRTAAEALTGPEDQARLRLKLAGIQQRRGDWASAERHLWQGLEGLPTGSEELEARLHAKLAVTAHRQGDTSSARERAEQAVRLAGEADDARATAVAHNSLGMVARAEGVLDEAVEHLEHAERLAEQLGDPAAAAAALNNLALTHADRGERARALELAKTALARCRRRGDRHHEAALLNNLADLLHAVGRRDEARAHLEQAVRLFAEIGHPHRLEPEIWKLVDW